MVSAVKVGGRRLHELARSGDRGRAGAAAGDGAPLRRALACPVRPGVSAAEVELLVGHLRAHPGRRSGPCPGRRCPPAQPAAHRHRFVHPGRGPPARRDRRWCRPARRCATYPRSPVGDETWSARSRHGKVLDGPRRWASRVRDPWAVLATRGGGAAGRLRGPSRHDGEAGGGRGPRRRRLASERCRSSTIPSPGLVPPSGTAVTIGAYDGVHRGHRAVIARVRRAGRDARPAERAGHLRSPPGQRGAPRVGAQAALRPATSASSCWPTPASTTRWWSHFDEVRAKEPPDDFVREVLVGALAARVVVVGDGLPLRSPSPGQRGPAARTWAPSSASRWSGSTWSGVDGRPAPEATPRSRRPPSARPWPPATWPRPPRCWVGPTRSAAPVVEGRRAGPRAGLPHRQRGRPRRDLPAGRRHLRRLVPPPRRCAPARPPSRSAGGPPSTTTSTPRCSRPTCSDFDGRSLRRAGPGPVRDAGCATRRSSTRSTSWWRRWAATATRLGPCWASSSRGTGSPGDRRSWVGVAAAALHPPPQSADETSMALVTDTVRARHRPVGGPTMAPAPGPPLVHAVERAPGGPRA